MKEKKSYIFSKILLVMVAIFIGLVLYTYKMIEDEKEGLKNKPIIEEANTPIYHPPLTQRGGDEEEDNDEEKKTTTIPPLNNDKNNSVEHNKTLNILEGAEYISPEEQLKREQEANLSEEIYDDAQIIPHNEIDNYPEAVTIPMTSVPSLGRRIDGNNQETNQIHPTLGTPIGDTSMSPF